MEEVVSEIINPEFHRMKRLAESIHGSRQYRLLSRAEQDVVLHTLDARPCDCSPSWVRMRYNTLKQYNARYPEQSYGVVTDIVRSIRDLWS